MSCLSCESESASVINIEDLEKEVYRIISESIELNLEELEQSCQSTTGLIERLEAPFTPMTFTLWRRVALKRIRKQYLDSIEH